MSMARSRRWHKEILVATAALLTSSLAMGNVNAAVSDVFLPSVGNWYLATNWNQGYVPSGASDAAFIIGNTTAEITSSEPDIQAIYVGQGDGNGDLQMVTGGYLAASGVFLGRDTSRYGLWYQSGGTLNTPYIQMAGANGTQGTFVIGGGSVSGVSSMDVGDSGLGGFTVAGGTLDTGSFNIATAAGSNYSYFNEAAGQVTVNVGVNVGSSTNNTNGLLQLSGGNFSWNGDVVVAGNGSALEVAGTGATDNWTGTSGAALTVGNGGAVHFDLTANGVSTLNLGGGQLDLNTGASLVINGADFSSFSSQPQTLQLINSGGMAGNANFSNVQLVGFQNTTASISYAAGNITLTVGPTAPPISQTVVGSATVVPDSQFNYMYAPSAMYDQTEGLYKVWTVYHQSRMSGGDHISYQSAPTLAGMANAPVVTAMAPSLNPYYFNDWQAADPSVYRDPATGIYYMAYDGNTDGTHLQEETRIGIAESFNGGRTFTPLYTNNAAAGYALIAPGANYVVGSYGVGQPAVVQANNQLWYMIYTDMPDGGNNPTMQVISSSSPTFSNYTSVAGISPNTVAAYSLDLAYDPTTSEFITIGNTTNTSQIGNNSIQLTFFNSNWQFVRKLSLTMDNQSFSFGEGVGLLTNAEKQILSPYLMTFFGATVNLNDLNNNVPAYWVRGNFTDLSMLAPGLTIPEPPALVLLATAGLALMLMPRTRRVARHSGGGRSTGSAGQGRHAVAPRFPHDF